MLGGIGPVAAVEAELTRLHADAIAEFLDRHRALRSTSLAFTATRSCIARPSGAPGSSGDGALLAQRLGIDVVADFRSADVAAGGEGAPLAPLLPRRARRGPAKAARGAQPRRRRQRNLDRRERGDILAFDTGPGNALIDDWVRRHTGAAADIGRRARRCRTRLREAHVARFLRRPYLRANAAEIARPRRLSRTPCRRVSRSRTAPQP